MEITDKDRLDFIQEHSLNITSDNYTKKVSCNYSCYTGTYAKTNDVREAIDIEIMAMREKDKCEK
jgi:hypothetical protein